MKKALCLLIYLLTLHPAHAFADDARSSQWLLVTAPAFRAAVEPLREYRQSDGLRVTVVQTTDVLSPREILAEDGQRLADHVHKLCRDFHGTTYILLVGAVVPGDLPDADKKVLPPLPGTISRMKGQPSDNRYGCLDGDRMPTVAVGRLPARTEDEARQMVRKILAAERDHQPGEWRQRITILAGVPAFNPFVDKLVEGMAMSRLSRLDGRWTGRAIYHNAGSRFCVPDDQLRDRALQYVQDGQALTLYLGHSWPQGLYAPKARFLDRTDWGELKIVRGPGVFATFGCNGCQLIGANGEGYGVAAMRNPAGPVAVLGSHGICFAAMCQLGADGLLDSLTAAQHPERLADAWLTIKRGIARGKIDDLTFKLLDSVDGDSTIPQATQRQEHLEMFLLLGDPAQRLPRIAEPVQLRIEGDAAKGTTVTVRGEVSNRLNGGRVRLTLERPLTSEPTDLETLPMEPAARQRVLLANHDRANRFVVSEQALTVRDGRFETKFTLPEKLPWPSLLLRAYAATERQEAVGTLAVTIPK